MATITDFPVGGLTWSAPKSKGVCKILEAQHTKGFLCLQFPPAKLCFDVVDPTSAFKPKLKLRVTGDLADWLAQLDQKATESLEDHLSECPYSPCLNETAYGMQVKLKPMDNTEVWIYAEERHKKRGGLGPSRTSSAAPP